MEEKTISLANGDVLKRTEQGEYLIEYDNGIMPLLVEREEGERLLFETVSQLTKAVETLAEENQKLQAFRAYWATLYGTGLMIAEWHQNGDLEAFDGFYEAAEVEMEEGAS